MDPPARKRAWLSRLAGRQSGSYERLPEADRPTANSYPPLSDPEKKECVEEKTNQDLAVLPSTLLLLPKDDDDAQDVRPLHERLHLDAPNDKNNLAYLIFLFLGAGMLFPWNVFITANDYIALRLRGSPFADNFQNFISIGCMFSNVSFLGVAVLTQKTGKPSRRTVVSLSLILFAFLACCVLTVRGVANDPSVFFGVLMVAVVVCGGSVAYLQSGVFGVVSVFPPIYTQAVMSGQGLAATMVALSQILTRLAGSAETADNLESQRLSALLYFLFALLVIVGCLVGWMVLTGLDIYRYYADQTSSAQPIQDAPYREGEEEEVVLNNDAQLEANRARFPAAGEPLDLNQWEIFKKLLPFEISVFSVFAVTLALHPAITAAVGASHPQEPYFVSIMFLIFALGDWFGKTLPGFPPLPLPPALFGRNSDGSGKVWQYGVINDISTVLLLTALRLVFVPLFIMSTQTSQLPFLISNSVGFYAVLVAFSVSNGWLGSLNMMLAPNRLQFAREKEIGGTIMVFCLTFGLAVGSGLSFLVRYAI